jgi:hypothetical protein
VDGRDDSGLGGLFASVFSVACLLACFLVQLSCFVVSCVSPLPVGGEGRRIVKRAGCCCFGSVGVPSLPRSWKESGLGGDDLGLLGGGSHRSLPATAWKLTGLGLGLKTMVFVGLGVFGRVVFRPFGEVRGLV